MSKAPSSVSIRKDRVMRNDTTHSSLEASEGESRAGSSLRSMRFACLSVTPAMDFVSTLSSVSGRREEERAWSMNGAYDSGGVASGRARRTRRRVCVVKVVGYLVTREWSWGSSAVEARLTARSVAFGADKAEDSGGEDDMVVVCV